jgi:hypothetical protein
MPLRINLIPQTLDEAVGKHPVFGSRQSGLSKHGQPLGYRTGTGAIQILAPEQQMTEVELRPLQ